MLPNPFARKSDPHLLAVSMTGVKMGDRVAFVGCAHGGRLAAVASKVGLSGRAVAVVPDERAAGLARRAAEQFGVLVEIEVTSVLSTPLEDGSIDLAVIDDTAGLFGAMSAGDRPAAVREVARILTAGRARHPHWFHPTDRAGRVAGRGARGAAFCGIRRGQPGALGKRLQHRADACRTRGAGLRRRHQTEDALGPAALF